ncbi:hypothetical protein Clacol_006714 [Clathrus columnatus]|uniref:GDP/GTP exchange factor Sec2 N-terminal domain-containing protein n=1 Tax=Clathrus columnatus TaxID=1419009 RepID=A0AAV5AFG0_9AGAM|nr:hypothetical protein Clacol_006714 [Clathrus columnatus]
MLSGVSFLNAERPQAFPQRSHSLNNFGKSKSDPVRESAQDVERARQLLNKHIADSSLDEEENKSKQTDWESQEELFQSFARMIEWVEELSSLLQKAYETQSEVETALMLAKSNLQMALANNEMLEDALKQAGPNVRDIGWRRLSERERLRQAPKEDEETESIPEEPSSPIHKPNSPPPAPPPLTQSNPVPPLHHQPTSSLRFFNFPSLSRSAPPTTGNPSQMSSRAESPTGSQPISHPFSHSRPTSPAPSRPTPREKELAMRLEKEKEALKSITEAKLALENELETLSQALFEEANKMVATSNRKLAETEDELREVMEEREALRAALHIIETENGVLRARSSNHDQSDDEEIRPNSQPNDLEDDEETSTQRALSANSLRLDESSSLADRVSFITIPPVKPESYGTIWSPDTLTDSDATKSLPSHGSPPNKPLTLHHLNLYSQNMHTNPRNFWTGASTDTPPSTPTHSPNFDIRLSVIPQTPHTRMAVKNEFEKAMLRMKRLIEDVEGHSNLPRHDIEGGGVSAMCE